jgi:hypothetical protein
MRPCGVVVMQPRDDGRANLVETVPVAEPDERLLERADESLDDRDSRSSA